MRAHSEDDDMQSLGIEMLLNLVRINRHGAASSWREMASSAHCYRWALGRLYPPEISER